MPASFLAVQSPYDLKIISELEIDNEANLESKLASAKRLNSSHPFGLPKDQRTKILIKLVQVMQAEAEHLAELATSEGGKPLRDSRIEVARAINGIELARDYLNKMSGEEIPMNRNAASKNREAWTLVEPIGLVAAISAFNHPLNLIVHQVLTAFAAGCPVIVKPALETPLSCMRLVELMKAAGCPENWIQVLICDNHVAEKLACDPRINYLSFIGSAKIGWHLRSKIAPGTRCALEHGGIAPAIVCDDADLKTAATALLKGGFYHAGQVCVSVQRIFVHEAVARQFLKQLKSGAQKLVVGDPMNEKTEVGPLIRQGEISRITEWINEAVVAGSELICGGKQIGHTCLEPTILLNPPANCKVSTLEIFGPVVCVYTFKDIDQAIEMANNTRFHFQSAVFSGDNKKAEAIASKLNASTVMINDHTAFRVDWMPFGGRDESGLGIAGIKYSMDEMSRYKLIVRNES